MGYLLGIDLGTSGVKAMLLEPDSGSAFVESVSYAVDIPLPGRAEQAPEMWWEHLRQALAKLAGNHPAAYKAIRSVGLSGQMHGLVLLDKAGKPLRAAIVALDQRSGRQVAEMEEQLTRQELGAIFHNRPVTGFAFPSLLWVRDNEPEVLRQAFRVLQPKDYIRYRLTGSMESDYTDASASLAFDLGKNDWAWEVFERFRIPPDIFPRCGESSAVAGALSELCARETGLPAGIPVVYGCGDQQAQSIGNGVIREGIFVANIGTSGQISTYRQRDAYDPELRTHTFCHAFNHAYTVFGAALCSGMSLNWLKNKVLHLSDYAQLDALASRVPPGSEGVVYLPYLSGERTPHMDHNACGQFYGLRLGHDRAHFIRSVMEGVVYSLKNSLDILGGMGLAPELLIASGGGARSPLWLQMQADIFEREIAVCDVNEQACLGAAILAGVGAGVFSSVPDACGRLVRMKERIYRPDEKTFEAYRAGYDTYNRLCACTKALSVSDAE